MPEKKFDLGDYVEVKDRIRILYELYPQARLVTSDVTMHTDPDGKQRVMVKALAYRNPEDTLPGVGHSWMELPGTTSYTKGSELENTETSAWGRAIAALGILIDQSIASRQEVGNKADDGTADTPTPPTNGKETEELIGTLRKTGTVRKGSSAKYQLDSREAPDGTHTVGFRLELPDDRDIPQVLAEGPAGEAIHVATAGNPAELVGVKVTVKGRLYNVKAQGRRGYYRLRVLELEAPEWKYPADEPAEAETAPLFDETEQAAIGAAVEKAGTAA